MKAFEFVRFTVEMLTTYEEKFMPQEHLDATIKRRETDEAKLMPQHFDAKIKGLKGGWEVGVWDAVSQISTQSLHASPSKKEAKEAKKLTQILVANLKWIRDFSPSKGTQKLLQKFEQLVATMILAANSPPLQTTNRARTVFSRLSATLDALLSNATPSNDADVAFINHVKLQLPVIHRQMKQLTSLVGTKAEQSGATKAEIEVTEEDDLASNFVSLVLDRVVVPTPSVEKATSASPESKSESKSESEPESEPESDNMHFLSCLLDYFREHPNQFPIATQRNARTFIRHVLKAQYGITQAEIARAINYSEFSMSRWINNTGHDDTIGNKVIEWINGPYQTWLLGSDEQDDERFMKSMKLANKLRSTRNLLSCMPSFLRQAHN